MNILLQSFHLHNKDGGACRRYFENYSTGCPFYASSGEILFFAAEGAEDGEKAEKNIAASKTFQGTTSNTNKTIKDPSSADYR
jgi:hypothetical protein